MALKLLAANNAQTVLSAGISSSATTLTVNTGTGALFPEPVSGTSFYKLTLVDAATGQLTEIMHVTARTGDVMTVLRAQEGTTARAWSANDIVANMLTAGTLSYMLDSFQPLNANLTSMSALAGGANKLPYFTGANALALTALTAAGRDLIGKDDVPGILTYLGLGEGSALPVGVPIPWPTSTAPTGWLKCNGATFTAAQYPKLALAYPGLVLPDLRGEFIRGWDDGRNVDIGRLLLSLQSHAFQDHKHLAGFDNGYDRLSANSRVQGTGSTLNNNSRTSFAISATTTNEWNVANETRPRNIAFNYIVRAA